VTTAKRLVVQITPEQWDWLQQQSAAFKPVSYLVRELIDKAMSNGPAANVSTDAP